MCDPVLPVEGGNRDLKYWSVATAPSELGMRSTTPSPSTIIRSLGACCMESNCPLLPDDPRERLTHWARAQQALGLKASGLYQLRHGGASDHERPRRRDMLDVPARGWSSIFSVSHQANDGKFPKMLVDLSIKAKEFVRFVVKRLPAFLCGEGQVPPQEPRRSGWKVIRCDSEAGEDFAAQKAPARA